MSDNVHPDANQDGFVAYRLLGASAPLTLSLPEQIAARLGDSIISDELRPGQHIAEQTLAAEYGVSRGPVREALRILEREGLVRIHSRRGSQVTELTEREVCDIFEVRATLLRTAVVRLVQDHRDATIQLRTKAIAELEQYADVPWGGPQYAETTFRSGLAGVRLLGNAKMTEIIGSLALQTLRYTRLGLASVERRRASLKVWKAGLKAMQRNDAEAAGDLAVETIMRSRDEILRIMRSEAEARGHAA